MNHPSHRLRLLLAAAFLAVLLGVPHGARADEVLDDAVKQLHVDVADVPGDAPAAGGLLLEFKRRMQMLERRVRGQLATAGQLKTQAGATDAEVRAFRKQILDAGRNAGIRLARTLRDPAMAYMVAEANRGRPAKNRIKLAGGTSPGEGGYRGGWGDIDLEGKPAAVEAFKKVFKASGATEKQAHKGGYVSYEEIDVTIHRMSGPLGEAGSGAHRVQVSADASSKETYVSAAMRQGQPGGRAVLVHDHIKKAHKGSLLAPADLMRNREALQSFAKGTLKTIETAGLSNRDLQRYIDKAGFPGTPEDFRAKLKALKSGGYAIAPGEIGFDVETMRTFQKASLEALSAADQRSWGRANQEMARVRARVKQLRAQGGSENLARANTLAAELLDSETRLNEVFKANKERFGFLAERSKVQAVLRQPRAEQLRFLTYMSDGALGRGIGLTLLMEQAKRDPRAARRLIEELPPHARERLRQEAGFRAFEAELQKTADPFWKRNVELPRLVATWKGRVDRLNARLNDRIQRCAYARGYARGMSAWGKVSEAEAYWKAWERGGPEELIVEIIRRRLPYITGIEQAMLGNYWMAGWDFVCSLLPPVGLLSAAGTIGISIGRYGVEYLHDAEILAFEEELYRTARFKLEGVTSLEDAKLGQWKLLHAGVEKRVMTRADLEAGRVRLAYATARTVESADPILQQLHAMAKHPCVGKRLYDRYQTQIYDRRLRVMQWWGRETIRRLELRKTAQDAWVRGSLPLMYAELMRITKDLEIQKDVDAAMDAALGQGLLDPLKQWVKDALFRKTYVQGTQQPSLREQAAGELVVRYLEAYRRVLAVRSRVEKHVGLEAKRDINLRLLSGPDLLSISPKADRKRAESWSPRGLGYVTHAMLDLDAIKARYIDVVSGRTAYDKEVFGKLAAHRAWIDAWKDVIVLAGANAKKTARAAQGMARRRFHQAAVGALFKAYNEHYAALSVGKLILRVRESRGGTLSDREVPGAAVYLSSPTRGAVQAAAMGGGAHVLSRLPLGPWTWTAQAPGYAAADGNPQVRGTVLLTKDAPTQEVEVVLHAKPDVIRLRFLDDRRRPVPGVTVTVRDGSGAEGVTLATDDGTVIIGGAYRGDWTAEAKAPGYAPATSKPIHLDPAGGKKVTPQPVTMTLTPYKAALAITVLDERGLPVEGARVGLETRRATTDANGHARIEQLRPAHDARLQVHKSGFARYRERADFLAPADGHVFTRRVVLTGGVTLVLRAIDAVSRAPLADVELLVSSLDEHASVMTNAQGLATVKNLPPDFVYVTASLAGYLSPTNLPINLRDPLGQATSPHTIELHAGMTVRVLVEDPYGDLLPGARVRLDGGPARLAATGTAELAPVKAGKHTIHAARDGYTEVSVSYVAEPAKRSQDVVRIRLAPGVTLRARVLDETGGLYRAAPTTLALRQAGKDVARAAGPETLFTNLEPGRYELIGKTPGAPAATSEAIDLGTAPATGALFVRLASPGLLRVWVEGEREGRTVDVPAASIQLEGPGGTRRDQGQMAAFTGLSAGTYRVRAEAPGFKAETREFTLPVPTPGQVTDVKLRLTAEGKANDDTGGEGTPKGGAPTLEEILKRIPAPAGSTWSIQRKDLYARLRSSRESAAAAPGGRRTQHTTSVTVMRIDNEGARDEQFRMRSMGSSSAELDRGFVAKRKRVLKDYDEWLKEGAGTKTHESNGKGETGSGSYESILTGGIFERGRLVSHTDSVLHEVITGSVIRGREEHTRTITSIKIKTGTDLNDATRTVTTLTKTSLGEVVIQRHERLLVLAGPYLIEARLSIETHVHVEAPPIKIDVFSIRQRVVAHARSAAFDGDQAAVLSGVLGLAGK